MKPTQIIGKNISYFRGIARLSQNQLAAFLGISRELISYYENGKRDIPVTSLNKLSDLFGVEVEELLEEDMKISNANLAFAFRREDLQSSDLEKIASFKRVVLNYIKMKNLQE